MDGTLVLSRLWSCPDSGPVPGLSSPMSCVALLSVCEVAAVLRVGAVNEM